MTVDTMTVMSVQRLLHMSRRSLTTSHHRYYAAIVILLFPIPSLVVYSLALKEPAFWNTFFKVTIANLFVLLSYHIVRLF